MLSMRVKEDSEQQKGQARADPRLPAIARLRHGCHRHAGRRDDAGNGIGAHFGYRRSLPYMTGIAAGLGSMAAAAAAGMGGIMLASPALQMALKLFGSIYLIWLAWRIGRSSSPMSARRCANRPASPVASGCSGTTPRVGP